MVSLPRIRDMISLRFLGSYMSVIGPFLTSGLLRNSNHARENVNGKVTRRDHAKVTRLRAKKVQYSRDFLFSLSISRGLRPDRSRDQRARGTR